MKKAIIRTLKVLAIVFLTVMVLLGVLVFVLNTSSFQNKLMRHSTQLLSEKLETEVSIDSVSVGFFTQEILLRGVNIEDQQQHPMLKIDLLKVSLEWLPLLRKEVHVSSAKLKGFKAVLYQPSPEEPANYQFIIDAFKKDTVSADSVPTAEEPDSLPKKKLELNIKTLEIEDVSLTYNGNQVSLAQFAYHRTFFGDNECKLKNLEAAFDRTTKKGEEHCTVGIAELKLNGRDTKGLVKFSGLHFANDNHLPRKNKGKPNRGAFDAGHLDIKANGVLDVSYFDKDTLVATLKHFDATDPVSGIEIKKITLGLKANKREAHLDNVAIQLPNTTLQFDEARLQLPSKKDGRKLTYSTSSITGNVLLKDISKPFAPVLSKFSIPLSLKVTMNGDDSGMDFRDISVKTTDNKLAIAARGHIRNLSDKYKLAIRFDVSQMKAKKGIAEKIINQFPVKKFMMKQLDALGDITYKGDFAVLWRKEEFQGKLATAVGNLDFHFALDENNKYVFGTANTEKFELGKAFDMKELGAIACSANFRFDISKPRTAVMRKKLGGKLPIGDVEADIKEVTFKGVKVRNVISTIKSDGAVANGNITIKGKRIDLLCSFSFTNTESIKSKLKVKPGMKIHKLSDDDKAAKEQKKQQKQQEKAEAKAKADQERQARKEAKAIRKQQEAEEKAARKQQKAAEKELRKKQKEEEKLLKRRGNNLNQN
jgi:hypothetical protein